MNQGGLLAFDNVPMAGLDRRLRSERARRGDADSHDRLVDDERVDSVMLGMGDGLTLARVR